MMKTRKSIVIFLSLFIFVSSQLFSASQKAYAATNLALNKLPSSSVNTLNISRLTDGDKNTSMYTATPFTGWIQIDLGASTNVDSIKLWHYYGDNRMYHDVIVQLSNDASFTTGITTVFNNDTDNSLGLGAGTDSEYMETSAGKNLAFTPVSARYARFYSNGNTVNAYTHYVEIEVYGDAVVIPDPRTNLALNKLPFSSVNTLNISRLTDGDKNTSMYTATSFTGWIQIDLGASTNVDGIRLWHYYGDSRKYRDVIVQLSNDASFATGITTVFNNDTDNSLGLGLGTDSEYVETSSGKDIAFTPASARYVRFYSNGNTVNVYTHYVEIEVYGDAVVIPDPRTNLVLNKLPLSSVNTLNISRSTDGDKNTSMYTVTPYTGWLQIDLGASTNVDGIKLWHYYGDSRKYRDIIVQLSNDASFATGITTVFNNDTDNSLGLGAGTDSEYVETSSGKDIAFTPTSARYVRFYSNGNTVNAYTHYVEIEVYGDAVVLPDPKPATLLFTFDDGNKDALTVAAPLLQAKGFKATAYVSRDITLEAAPDALDLADIAVLYNDYGWDIGNHTTQHYGLSENSLNNPAPSMEALVLSYLDNQNWILENGWSRGANHVAYPYGEYNTTLITSLQGMGVLTARCAWGGIQPMPVQNYYTMPALGVEDSSFENVKNQINVAINTNSTIILMFHVINETSGSGVISLSNFQAILDFIEQYSSQNKINVVTISEFYNQN